MRIKRILSIVLTLAMLVEMFPSMSLTAHADGNTTEITQTNTSGTMTITLMIKAEQTITFDTDGGTEIPAITCDYGDPVTAPEDPVKEMAKFIGWDQEIPETMPAADITITAMWSTLTEVPGFPAECESEGIETYYEDEDGNIYADKYGLIPATIEDLIIPELGHDFDENDICRNCNISRRDLDPTYAAPTPAPVTVTVSSPTVVTVTDTTDSTEQEVPANDPAPVSAGSSSEGGSSASSSGACNNCSEGKITAKYNRAKGTIELNWDEIKGADGYVVELVNSSKASRLAKTKENTYTYKKAELGKIYRFRVKYSIKGSLSKASQSYTIIVRTKNAPEK